MIIRFILYCCIFHYTTGLERSTVKPPRCLTGNMTDVQSWVDEFGTLIGVENGRNAIDLSATPNAVTFLQQNLLTFRSADNITAQYLSMARCQLTRVPQVFNMKDREGRPLRHTVRYISLYGNEFQDPSTPGEHYHYILNATSAIPVDNVIALSTALDDKSTWALGFHKIKFTSLLELDLRACNIQILSSKVFFGMSELRALYLSDNNIVQVDGAAFSGLSRLLHLDLSRNHYYTQVSGSQTMSWGSMDVFERLDELVSLDLSHTKLASVNVLRTLGERFQRLSLCHTGVTRLRGYFFENSSLKLLDVSGNIGILGDRDALRGIEDSLEILYADSVALQTIDTLIGFEKLEVLKVSNNEIAGLSPQVTESWTSIQIIDMDFNRMASWFIPLFSLAPRLGLLSLRSNSINLISEEMIKDMERISFIGLSGNFFFCNCHSREFFDVAVWNELKRSGPERNLAPSSVNSAFFHLSLNFHTGFQHFNELVWNRTAISTNCSQIVCGREIGDEVESIGNFLLFDYEDDSYNCFILENGTTRHFSELSNCNQNTRDGVEDIIRGSNAKIIAMIVIPTVLMPILALGFVFRRSFKYFMITMRNSALLSLINKPDQKDEGAIFNYDVFVSYCNEDRPWILEHLLPHVETDCNVSVCLHERDFQVGLSILENIASCMDRSRSIMLVISQRFLLSQWCQFEMHLAQHRLLETRREDLILILLEDIPRRLRPNTLHYLMLTKTYIVWPKEQAERPAFWRRVKKSVITQRVQERENVSLA